MAAATVPLMYLLGIPGLTISLAVALHPKFWFQSYHPLFGFPELQRFYGLLPPTHGPAYHWLSLAWLGGFCLLLFWSRLKRMVRDKAKRQRPAGGLSFSGTNSRSLASRTARPIWKSMMSRGTGSW